MKRSTCLFWLLILLALNFDAAYAQKKKRSGAPPAKTTAAAKAPASAIVVDERLSVLRTEPGFAARVVQRMRRGRTVQISAAREADGALFYRVSAAPNAGWIQSEAVASRFKRGDDARLARLVQSSEGFEQIERARIFLDAFNDSPVRPAMLLLFGDLIEETALKLSSEATRRLDRREMAASGAPLHTFYLNYAALDRYRRLGANFAFNADTKLFHYDGASWREIVKKHPQSNEAAEAQKRLAALEEKMESTGKKP